MMLLGLMKMFKNINYGVQTMNICFIEIKKIWKSLVGDNVNEDVKQNWRCLFNQKRGLGEYC